MSIRKSNHPIFVFILCCLISVSAIAQVNNFRKINLSDNTFDVKSEINLIQSLSNQVSFSVKIPTISLADLTQITEKYQMISVDGFSQIDEPGKPALPILGKLLAVPENADVQIQISGTQYKEIDQVYIHPASEPLPESNNQKKPRFVLDKVTYESDQYYPAEIAWTESVKIIRGNPISLLWIAPVQFNPVQRKVRIYTDFVITVSFGGNSDFRFDPRLQSSTFDDIMQRSTVNWSSVKFARQSLKKINKLTDTNSLLGFDFLIVTHREFKQAADSLAAWRRLNGLKTKVVLVEDIGNSATSIKEYIQTAYDTWSPAPTFVALIGDAEYIPTNYQTDHPSDNIEKIATDLYYTTVDGADYYPDLILGRISVDTKEEAMSFVQKVINYEKNPVTDPEFYQQAKVAAYFQDDDDEDTPEYNERDGFEDRRFILTSEEIRNFLLSANYSVDRIYYANSEVNPTNYNDGSYANGEPLPAELLRSNGFTWEGNANDISRAINEGTFLVSHRDHGSRSGWGDPSYRSSHVRVLNNGRKLPVIFSINCNTGWFDNETDAESEGTGWTSECFVENWLRNLNGGAVGVFGATRVSYSGYNDALAKGCFDAIWPQFLSYQQPGSSGEPIYYLGQVMNYGKFYMATRYSSSKVKVEFEEFHYYGDPATSIRTHVPADFFVDAPDSIFYNQTEMSINVFEKNAVTTLVQENKILATTKSNDDGIARLNFNPISSNLPVQLCVTKPNFKPYLSHINVFSTEGTCLVLESADIIDQDNNDEINIGETISWNLNLKNAGLLTERQILLNLNCNDQFIVLNDSSVVVDSLSNSETRTINDLSFMVKNTCSDNHLVEMSLEIEVSSDYNLSIPLDFIVKDGMPVLEFAPGLIATSVTSLNDSTEASLQISNSGFGELQFSVKDETSEIISVEVGNDPKFYSTPEGAGNIYYFDKQTNILQFSCYLQVNSPITLFFFVYQGDQHKGIYYKIAESSSYIDQLGEKLYWSDFLNTELQENKYYYLGVSWSGGDAKIARAAKMPPFDNSLGYIKTGTVKLGGVAPADSVNQTTNRIFAFGQQIKTGEGVWFKCDPIDRSLLSLESAEIPLKFYATHQDTTFHSNILITTNDAQHDSVLIPVHFMVDDVNIKLVWQINQIDDSKGNDNNEINLAEKISLPLTIKNIGNGTANNVVAHLSSSDPYMILNDSLKTLGPLEAGKQISETAFAFEISPYCLPGHVFNYDVSLGIGNNILEKLQLSGVVKEGEPKLEFQPDSLVGSISQLHDSLLSEIEIKNNGFGRLFYQLKNPIQENYSVGTVAKDKWLASNQGVGNVFHQIEDAHLLKVQFYLQIDSASTVYFFVYEGNESKGDYRIIAKNQMEFQKSITGWISSGAIECDLLADKFYYIGVSGNGDVKICRAKETIPFKTNFNEISTSAYNLGGFPPADSVYQKNQVSIILAQKLITGQGLWLDIPIEPDTLYPKESRITPVTFSANAEDTTFFAEIILNSNDPQNSIISLPTKLVVNNPVSDVLISETSLPNSMTLFQNYPNPFNPTTEIRYAISKKSDVNLSIYNIMGQKIIELVHKKQRPGFYNLTWNGHDSYGNPLSSGVYFMILKADKEISVRKVLLLK